MINRFLHFTLKYLFFIIIFLLLHRHCIVNGDPPERRQSHHPDPDTPNSKRRGWPEKIARCHHRPTPSAAFDHSLSSVFVQQAAALTQALDELIVEQPAAALIATSAALHCRAHNVCRKRPVSALASMALCTARENLSLLNYSPLTYLSAVPVCRTGLLNIEWRAWQHRGLRTPLHKATIRAMRDSHIGCVSEPLTREEGSRCMCQQQLAQTVSVAYEKKPKKQSESFPLNWPPTQSLCWVFPAQRVSGNRGGVGQRLADLVLNGDQGSGYVLIAGVKRNKFWPFIELFSHIYHLGHTRIVPTPAPTLVHSCCLCLHMVTVLGNVKWDFFFCCLLIYFFSILHQR